MQVTSSDGLAFVNIGVVPKMEHGQDGLQSLPDDGVALGPFELSLHAAPAGADMRP